MRKRSQHPSDVEPSDFMNAGKDDMVFKNYRKLKATLIIWNLVIAMIALVIFTVVLSRFLDGIKQPWLFKYAFSSDRVFNAVHTVEKKYQPASLIYVEVIYIILPMYLCFVYLINALFVIIGAAWKAYQLLYIAKHVSLSMNWSVCVLMLIFGVIMNNLVDDYLTKWNRDHMITMTELEKDISIAKIIITSYVAAFAFILMAAASANYYAVSRLNKLMKYYTEQKIEQQMFIPLPSIFTRSNQNTQVGDDVDRISNSNSEKSDEV